jgi:hypothetical protein
MATTHLEHYLDHVEQSFGEAAQALASGDPLQSAVACEALQQIAVAFLQASDETGRNALSSPALKGRIQALALAFSQLQDALRRNSAYVDRALETVVPTEKPSTYAASQGIMSGAVYGTAIRQSGSFTYLAA